MRGAFNSLAGRKVCESVSVEERDGKRKGGRGHGRPVYITLSSVSIRLLGFELQPPWEQRLICKTYAASINGLLLQLAIKVCQEQPGHNWELFFSLANGTFVCFQIYCANYLECRKLQRRVTAIALSFPVSILQWHPSWLSFSPFQEVVKVYCCVGSPRVHPALAKGESCKWGRRSIPSKPEPAGGNALS